jgi:hypothetical protein
MNQSPYPYSEPLLFSLGYLYIHLHQPQKAEHLLWTLCLMNKQHHKAKVLLAVSMIMQGKTISVKLFNHVRQHASSAMVMMMAKRLQSPKAI